MGLMSGIAGFLTTPERIDVPEFQQLQPGAIESTRLSDIQGSLTGAGNVTQAAALLGAGQLNALQNIAVPGGQGLMQSNITSLMRGELPASVQQSLLSSGAASALAAGFGGTGYQATGTMLGMRGRALEAMQMGMGAYQQYTSPYLQMATNPMSQFLDAGQRTALAQWQAEQNYQRNLLEAQIEAQPSQSNMQLASLLGSMDISIGEAASAYSAFGGRRGGGGTSI